MPSATVFLLLLCNDKAVLGPWVNGRWLNLFTGLVIWVLVLLSLILTAATVFPDMSGGTMVWVLGAGALAGVVGGGVYVVTRPASKPVAGGREWMMPPLGSLAPPVMTRGTRVWLAVLRVYLVVAVGMVAFKIVSLAAGA